MDGVNDLKFLPPFSFPFGVRQMGPRADPVGSGFLLCPGARLMLETP